MFTKVTVSPALIVNVPGLNPDDVLKNIHVARAYSSDHQMLLAEKVGDLIKDQDLKNLVDVMPKNNAKEKITNIRNITHVDSKYVNIMQMSDIIGGAIRDKFTGHNSELIKIILPKHLVVTDGKYERKRK